MTLGNAVRLQMLCVDVMRKPRWGRIRCSLRGPQVLDVGAGTAPCKPFIKALGYGYTAQAQGFYMLRIWLIVLSGC